MDEREIVGSPFKQGVDETITRTLTTTPYSAPTTVSVVAYDITDGVRLNVSATVLSGAATVLGDVITLPALTLLTVGHQYRVEVKFTSGGNVYEFYMIVEAEY